MMNSRKKQRMTVYLNTFEHEAMETLFKIFNCISDIVSSTQTSLELLQKSRKEIRDLINNEYDEIIEELNKQKMDLLQSLSIKYQKKYKKLQTQLSIFKSHRILISENKKQFEKISVNNSLNEYERETKLIKLVNKQIKKIKTSLNNKKIIISSSININSLSNKMKQCLNIMNNTKIISFENKQQFDEMYGDILMPLIYNKNNTKCDDINDIKQKQKQSDKIRRRSIGDSIQFINEKNKIKNKHKKKHKNKQQKKQHKIHKIGKKKKRTKHIVIDSDNDETSDGQILHDSDDPNNIISDLSSFHLNQLHKNQESVSSSSSSSYSSYSSSINGKEEIITMNNNNNNNNENDSDSSSIMIKERKSRKKIIDKNQEEININDELKDMEEDNNNNNIDKLRGKYGELCLFSYKSKSYGIELTNNNKVAHKNHGNFNEDYVLLDIEAISNGIKCFRFHQNSSNFALWGVVYKNNKNQYDLNNLWGCCTENAYIKNGKYIHNKIKTQQWSGKLIDMMLDLNKGQLLFTSPNFIEPKYIDKENKKLNEIIILNGIYNNKKWCPILKLQQINTFVMVREIPYQWFGKYPKAVKFDTFTHV